MNALEGNSVAVDEREVIVKELGCYSQGIEVTQRQGFQDHEPDLHRKYDAARVTIETLMKYYCWWKEGLEGLKYTQRTRLGFPHVRPGSRDVESKRIPCCDIKFLVCELSVVA
jgi:hypothetical protein